MFDTMELKSLEEHIGELDKRREKIFLESLIILGNSNSKLKNYYLVVLSTSGVVIFLNYFNIYFHEEEMFFRAINMIIIIVSIFSLAKYLNLAEKESEYYRNKLKELGLKYYQEIKIIENFYAGDVNEKEIREFYLRKEEDLFNEQSFASKNKEIISRWTVFVLLAVVVILLLF
jgi:hypothetical protein